MKKIHLFVIALLTFPAFGQTYYQDIGDEDYKNLIKNGLSYVLSGDAKSDALVEKALKDEWNVSPVKMIDPSKGESLNEDDVQLTLLAEAGIPFPLNLTIVSVKTLKKKSMTLYNTTALVNITGFVETVDEKNLLYFLPYFVKAFNDMALKMNEHKIEKRGLPYFNAMNALYLPNSKVLKEKTLLIIDNVSKVNEAELKKAGINYEVVTFDQFLEKESSEPENYCVLYLNPSQFSEITIFNLSDKSIVYTRHYVKNVTKLDKDDIKLIRSSWN
jgi:hypothetical protein